MKKWFIAGLLLIFVLSGCSIRMTAEEKLALYGDDSIQLQGDGNVKIEQLESNQVPTIVTTLEPFSANVVGSLFLNFTPEEVDQSLQEYYKYMFEKDGTTEETLKEIDGAHILSNGDATVTFSNYTMRFYKFPEVDRYTQVAYSVYRAYDPNSSGVGNLYTLFYRQLSAIFPKNKVTNTIKETIQSTCDPIAETLNFSPESIEIYTMDAESMNKVQKATGFASLDTEVDESGKVVGELKPWTEEQEAYLLLYKRHVGEQMIESVYSENILFLIYHPEQGLLFAEALNGINGNDIVESSMQTVMSGEDALTEAKIYFSNQKRTDITITSVTLKYMIPYANLDYAKGQMIIEPCWDVEYQYIQNGVTLTDHILLHAVTGIVETGNTLF